MDRPMTDHACYLSRDWETYDSARVMVHCHGCDFEVVSGKNPTPAEVWAIEQAHLADVAASGGPPPVAVHHPPDMIRPDGHASWCELGPNHGGECQPRPAPQLQPVCGHVRGLPFYELTTADINKPTIRAFGRTWMASSFIGRVLPTDVGKRVYLTPCDDPAASPILQVESDAQRDARLERTRT